MATPRVLGVDSGGTFTDFVLWEGGEIRTFKRPSTPADPSAAILEGIAEAGYEPDEVAHGTTVATNTILTKRGARTAFVTTKGFRNILSIGRQARAREDLYSLRPRPQETLVPRELCFEVDERVSAEGEVLRALSEDEARRVMANVAAAGVECVAICLLFSFLYPEHERMLKRIAEEQGIHASTSHEVLAEAREYERASTTVINAYVGPAMARYLEKLDRGPGQSVGRLRVMLSDGTTAGAAAAGERAVRTVLSGPAAGVAAAFSLASGHGETRVLTFDMGGTSTDVAYCFGEVALRRDVLVGGLPIATPAVDVHSVGAGGGSVAYIDEAGALRVGPESAGAEPGPAAYGNGGPATVTDAHCVLGRIGAGRFLGGRMALDEGTARQAIEGIARALGAGLHATAAAIVDVANAEMERALRRVTVERGYDPREAALVAFGGAGPLHACDLASAFGIGRILVPPHPGLLSALGLVIADEAGDAVLPVYREVARGGATQAEAGLRHRVDEAARELAAGMRGETHTRLFVALKYPGQSHELLMAAQSLDVTELCKRFDQVHLRRFGHCDPASPVEIATVRVRVSAPSGRHPRTAAPKGPPPQGTPCDFWAADEGIAGLAYEREELAAGMTIEGPAIVYQMDSTTLVASGWRALVADDGTLVMERL